MRCWCLPPHSIGLQTSIDEGRVTAEGWRVQDRLSLSKMPHSFAAAGRMALESHPVVWFMSPGENTKLSLDCHALIPVTRAKLKGIVWDLLNGLRFIKCIKVWDLLNGQLLKREECAVERRYDVTQVTWISIKVRNGRRRGRRRRGGGRRRGKEECF